MLVHLIITVCILIVLIILKFIFFRLYDNSLIIVSAHFKENLDWLKKVPYKVIVCDKPGADPMNFEKDSSCSIDVNIGREVSSFLKYIIENYDNLPNRIAFIHGHEEAWHQSYPGGILKAIKDAKPELDFVNLNVYFQMNVENKESPDSVNTKNGDNAEYNQQPVVFAEMERIWSDLIEPIVKYPLPKYIRFMCCAQFIVTKKALYRIKRDEYKKLYEYVMSGDGTPHNDWLRGVIIEYIWHTMFTGVNNDICDGLLSECTTEEYIKTHFNP